MKPTMFDIEVQQGATLIQPFVWEDEVFVYAQITAISKTAPVQITAAAHGLVNGWRSAIVSVLGMKQINAEDPAKLSPRDFHKATVVSGSMVEFNDINAADFSTYISGGYLQYYKPIDLSGYTARAQIKDKINGAVLLSLTTENGGISVDNVAKTIMLHVSATATAALNKNGFYDLEMVSSGGDVYRIAYGVVTISKEVTTLP